MKKILMLLILGFAVSACYDDYILDYDYDAIYFPYQYDVRTFVVGEGMQIKMGVALGGVRENNRDRLINYQLDNSLISPATLAAMQGSAGYIKNSLGTELKLLPSDYYSLSDGSQMVIKKGDHSGTVTLTPDSAAFLADPDALTATYAIPVRIVSTDADADSVLSTKDFAVIAFKYESMLFGNYWHGGRTIVRDPSDTPIDTILYHTAIPSPEAKVWKLITVEPFAMTSNSVSDFSSSPPKPEMKITLDPGGNVLVSGVAGATFPVEPDGPSVFNQAKLLQDRKILLNYKYQDALGNTYHATDTLTFRNRVRDGVNEWQDENPENYN